MLWPVARFGYRPFEELARLQNEVNKLFESVGGGGEAFPAVNIYTNNEAVALTAEIPGVKPDELDVSVIEDLVTIQGERKAEEMEANAVCHRAERGVGRFIRSFRLPYNINAEKVKASVQNGVLRVDLPRAEESKPRKISVSTC